MTELIRQRRFGVRTSFSFGSDALTYGLGDWTSVRTQVVPYEVLDLTSRDDFSIGNTGYVLRWSALLIPAWLLMQFIPEPWFGVALAGALIFALVLAASIALEWTEVRFTEIGTFNADNEGVRRFLRVIRDARHDAILSEFETHWRDRMRRLYAGVDLLADPNQEAGRHEWLHRLGVVTDEEFGRTLDQLRAAAAAPATPPHRPSVH